MYVVVPPGPSAPGTNAWARGVRQPSIAESVDLCLRLCDLASLPLPNMALGGESLRALLYQPVGDACDSNKRRIKSVCMMGAAHIMLCRNGLAAPVVCTATIARMGTAIRTSTHRTRQ